MTTRPPQPLVHVSVAIMDGTRVLLVREEKPAVVGLWNLPGGHMERGESILQAARRELEEETTLRSNPSSLVGIYSTLQSIRFAFRAPRGNGEAVAGHEILEVGFFELKELRGWPDESFVGWPLLRQIFADLEAGASHRLDPFFDLPEVRREGEG